MYIFSFTMYLGYILGSLFFSEWWCSAACRVQEGYNEKHYTGSPDVCGGMRNLKFKVLKAVVLRSVPWFPFIVIF